MWQVIPAGPADAAALSQVIADAFLDLPPARWLIPGEAVRAAVFPGYFRIFVDLAMTGGTVHTVPDRSAVAMWLPVGADGPGPPGEDYDARLAAVTGPWAPRFTAFDTALDEHHLTGTAHQYLAIMAVHPTAQGRGIGTALLRAQHSVLDQAGIPAYLEASAVRNRALYLRHGYILRPDAPFYLPEYGPPMWPMIRPATAAATG